MSKLSKKERQKSLKRIIEENPFYTDRELAAKFEVSIQTIRLDRLELGIPEVRERTKNAASAYARLRSVNEGEVIGELTELELDAYAESYLETSQEMALHNSNIIRGSYVYAQANSLATAVINAERVLTGTASIKYHKAVMIGDVIKARAELKDHGWRRYTVEVKAYRENDLVFSGDFIMFADREGFK